MSELPQLKRCCDGREPSAGLGPESEPRGGRPGGSSAGAAGGAAGGSSRDGRRGFLFNAGAALMGLGGLLAALPLVGAVFAPARRGDPNDWVDLGPIDQFPEGTTRLAHFTNPVVSPTDGQTAVNACWVRSLGKGEYQIFAVNCAHLGCPVRWFEQSRLFMCPCHGGVYYEDGSRASGPPPRGLFVYESKRVVNGRLQIEAGQLPGLQEGT